MKPSILIVDDEMAICISLKYSLNQDYDISIATSIDEARKELSQKAIHLVLLDLYIGSDDGMEFLQIIKAVIVSREVFPVINNPGLFVPFQAVQKFFNAISPGEFRKPANG